MAAPAKKKSRVKAANTPYAKSAALKERPTPQSPTEVAQGTQIATAHASDNEDNLEMDLV